MEDVEEPGAGRQLEVVPQGMDSTDSHEHADGTPEGEESLGLKELLFFTY